MDPLPLESNSNPVGDSGTRTSAAPVGEQILPIISFENASVAHSPEPTLDEPHGGRSVNQSSRIPEVTSQMLSQGLSGTSRPLNTPLAVPSGQGAGASDISTPPEISQLQNESPAHTRNEGTSRNMNGAVLEEVVPEKGPTTGRIRIILLGERFPSVPLFVGFGDNWTRAVSHA